MAKPQAVAILTLWWLAAGRRPLGWSRTRRIALAAAAGIAITGLLVPLQMRLFPTTPLPVNAVPTSVAAMSETLADTQGDDVPAIRGGLAEHLLQTARGRIRSGSDGVMPPKKRARRSTP